MEQRTKRAPARIALAAITFAGFTVGAVVIAWLAQLFLDRALGLTSALAAGAVTAMLSAAVGQVAIGSKRGDGVAAALTVGLAMGAGILCSPLALAAVSLTTDPTPFREEDYQTVLIAATCLGTFYSVPLGAMFGLAFLPPVLWARRLGADASHERSDRALRACGAWLGATGGLAILLAPGWAAFWPWLAAAPLAAGIVLALAGIARIERRRRWFLGVAAGHRPGWAVVPRSTLLRTDDLRPLFRCPAGDRVLVVRRDPRPGGAYRTVADVEPFALAPDPAAFGLS